MENLKPLAELTEPDPRQEAFAVLALENDPFSIRKRTIEDVYAGAASITLSDKVPEKIKSHFATALNLVAYSWLYYPFNVTAQFMAYVSVEQALRLYYGNKRTPLKRLLTRAVREQLIREDGFSHRLREPPPTLGVDVEPTVGRDYAAILIDTLPFLRNELAHGSNMLTRTVPLLYVYAPSLSINYSKTRLNLIHKPALC
jgi:hypothetical protein